MCNIFLSYSRKDYEIVRIIKQEIEQATKAKCWMDLDGISYDSPDFTKIIAPSIEQAPMFVFILTLNSQVSEYARNELLLARTRKKHIFFVEPRECEMTSEFILEYGHYNRNLYYIDYQKRKLYEEIDRLLDYYERGTDIEEIKSKSVDSGESLSSNNELNGEIGSDCISTDMAPKTSLQKWLDECRRMDVEIAKQEEAERIIRQIQKAAEEEKRVSEERKRMMEKFRRKHENKKR